MKIIYNNYCMMEGRKEFRKKSTYSKNTFRKKHQYKKSELSKTISV